MSNLLAEQRVLVVEDEYFLMEELCRDLGNAGAVVVGPAPSIEKALALIAAEPGIDVAVLDVNLGGRMAYPVADMLLSRSIPFIFATGYEDGLLDKRYPDISRVAKPTEFRLIEGALATALSSARTA